MKKMRTTIYIVLILILVGVFLYSGWSLLDYYRQSSVSQEKYDSLANLVEAARPTRPQQIPADPAAPTEATTSPLVTVIDPDTGESTELLREFEQAYLLNKELVGWICIDGTNINYPVVQSAPDNADYYLHRDFYGDYDSHGCIYVREQCDVFLPSDNLVIYGHRMKDHTMFGQLAKYEEKDFWQANRYVQFDTLTEYHTYEIAYVFITTSSVGEGFAYHQFVNARDEEHWTQFLEECKRLSLYDTGVEIQPGDKLITLSTCEYTQQNGRLVVVAKQIN